MKRTIILLSTVLTMITFACNHHRRHNQDASIQEISKDETDFEETSSKKSYTNEEKRKAKESLALQAEIANAKICAATEIQERLSSVAQRELYETITLPTGQQVQKQTTIRDSVKALELLAKINGMFVSKAELDISAVVPVVIKDDI